MLSTEQSVDTAGRQYNTFVRYDTAEDFAAWVQDGTAVTRSPDGSSVRLATEFNTPAVIGADSQDHLPLLRNSRYSGAMTSPILAVGEPIDHVVVSWNAVTPEGTWLEVRLRARTGDDIWTPWYALAVWASDTSAVRRHSIDEQDDECAGVDTDTFYLTLGQKATAYQLQVALSSTSLESSPQLQLVSAVASRYGARYPMCAPDQAVWGTNLPVPARSQRLPEYRNLGYGGGGGWCSPTSVSMVMAYWSRILERPDLDRAVPDVARDTYDFTYKGTGNWPFNTAYAARFGLVGYVTRMYSMSQVEQWVKSGVPIVISVRYERGMLPRSPIESTSGHLLVVRGFTADGDVVTNDPAGADDAQVEIVYARSDLERVWRQGSHGAAYVIYPRGWPLPGNGDDCW